MLSKLNARAFTIKDHMAQKAGLLLAIISYICAPVEQGSGSAPAVWAGLKSMADFKVADVFNGPFDLTL
jgi:hypothetical protein